MLGHELYSDGSPNVSVLSVLLCGFLFYLFIRLILRLTPATLEDLRFLGGFLLQSKKGSKLGRETLRCLLWYLYVEGIRE